MKKVFRNEYILSLITILFYWTPLFLEFINPNISKSNLDGPENIVLGFINFPFNIIIPVTFLIISYIILIISNTNIKEIYSFKSFSFEFIIRIFCSTLISITFIFLLWITKLDNTKIDPGYILTSLIFSIGLFTPFYTNFIIIKTIRYKNNLKLIDILAIIFSSSIYFTIFFI